jgi:hypothetical protein
MTLSLADQVRLRIQDRYRWQSEEFFGDGWNSQFKLSQGQPFSTVVSGSAYNRLTTGYTATGAAFDTALGLVTLSGVVSANSAIKFNYQWAVFSDDEIGQFTAMGGGSVAGAALEAVKTLQFDSLKRARWAAPDGTQYDDTKAQDTLLKMYEQLWSEVRESPAGGIESWSEQQQNYQSEYNA